MGVYPQPNLTARIVPPFQRNQTTSHQSHRFSLVHTRRRTWVALLRSFCTLRLTLPTNRQSLYSSSWSNPETTAGSLANCSFSAVSLQTVFVWEAHPSLGVSLKLLGIDGLSQTLSQLAQALQKPAMWLLPIKPYICCINTTVPIGPEPTVFFMFIFSGRPCLVWQLTGLLLDLLCFLNAPIFLSHYDITVL